MLLLTPIPRELSIDTRVFHSCHTDCFIDHWGPTSLTRGRHGLVNCLPDTYYCLFPLLIGTNCKGNPLRIRLIKHARLRSIVTGCENESCGAQSRCFKAPLEVQPATTRGGSFDQSLRPFPQKLSQCKLTKKEGPPEQSVAISNNPHDSPGLRTNVGHPKSNSLASPILFIRQNTPHWAQRRLRDETIQYCRRRLGARARSSSSQGNASVHRAKSCLAKHRGSRYAYQ